MPNQHIDPPPKTKTVAEQQANFTDEGAPPPGKVVGSVVPATPLNADSHASDRDSDKDSNGSGNKRPAPAKASKKSNTDSPKDA